MTKLDYFSSSYVEAREKFLDAARASGGNLYKIQNPEFGPEGEALFMDAAYFGAKNITDALVISSGTHGVEGFAGSGIQTGLLLDGFVSRLWPYLNILLIHAINPYGMAHFRRFNEDNVDINRNFMDHSLPHPGNPEYEALADVIAPTSISFWSEVASWWRILWFRMTAGKAAAQAALSRGQYSHPSGLFYGGTFETWSTKSIRSIVHRYLSNANRIVVLDLHTGLGEYGNAEVRIHVPEDLAEYHRAVAIWGEALVKSIVSDESVSAHLDTSLRLDILEMFPNAELTSVVLEFGTVPPIKVYRALRAENWLHHYGDLKYDRAQEIKMSLLRAFYPEAKDWKTTIWEKGADIVERATMSFRSRQSKDSGGIETN